MEMKSIFAAFVKAQTGFAPALKTSTNPHFKSKYADLAACVEAVIDSLNANGIGLVQKTHMDETGVTVETHFLHESGESFSGGLLHVPASKQDPQGYGSALSYARRYSLMAACGIAPEDDDGNSASKNKNGTSKGIGVHSGPKAAYDSLPPDWQAWVDDFAILLTNKCEQAGPESAKQLMDETIKDNDLQAEHIAGLWSKLDSKIRSQIKAVAEKK